MSQENLSGMHERLMNLENNQKYLREKYDREITDIKGEQIKQNKRVSDLKNDQALDSQRITAMERQLNKIDDNTTYTRRQMTGILVGAVATGVIGGAITLIYAMIGSGII